MSDLADLLAERFFEDWEFLDDHDQSHVGDLARLLRQVRAEDAAEIERLRATVARTRRASEVLSLWRRDVDRYAARFAPSGGAIDAPGNGARGEARGLERADRLLRAALDDDGSER